MLYLGDLHIEIFAHVFPLATPTDTTNSNLKIKSTKLRGKGVNLMIQFRQRVFSSDSQIMFFKFLCRVDANDPGELLSGLFGPFVAEMGQILPSKQALA